MRKKAMIIGTGIWIGIGTWIRIVIGYWMETVILNKMETGIQTVSFSSIRLTIYKVSQNQPESVKNLITGIGI